MMDSPRKLLFSAGDLSGNIHAARVARCLRARHPNWQLYALGDAHLEAAGARIIGDTSHLGVIGFASAMAVLPRSLLLRRKLDRFLQSTSIDAALLCDWGGFNMRLLPALQRAGIPSLYYFPPRSWQKTGRLRLDVAQMATQIATPFQWSARQLQAAGAKAEWVGHPLLEIVEEVRQKYSRSSLRAEFGAREGELLIAILPGSRKSELQLLSPHLAGAIALLQKRFPSEKLRFVVAVPRGAAQQVRAHFPDMPVHEECSTKVLLACDAAFVKSGTITLEAAVCDAPQIVFYDVSPIVHAQIRLTGLDKKIPFVAMPNIILGRMAVPELLGARCRAPELAEAMSGLLADDKLRQTMRQEYSHIRAALGVNLTETATERTADLLEEMLAARLPVG